MLEQNRKMNNYGALQKHEILAVCLGGRRDAGAVLAGPPPPGTGQNDSSGLKEV